MPFDPLHPVPPPHLLSTRDSVKYCRLQRRCNFWLGVTPRSVWFDVSIRVFSLMIK